MYTLSEKKSELKEETSYSKPGYDGRLQFYDIWKENMKIIALASYYADYPTWFNAIKQMYFMAQPYMPCDKAAEVKAKIKKLNNNINMISSKQSSLLHNRMIKNYIQTQLENIQEMLYLYAKHLMLPISDEDESEYDFDEFKRDSDL